MGSASLLKQRTILILASAVAVLGVTFCVVRATSTYALTPWAQADAPVDLRHRKTTEEPHRVPWPWFKRASEDPSAPACRGELHLVVQYPVILGTDWGHEYKRMAKDKQLDGDSRLRRMHQLEYAKKLALVHHERRQAEYTETLRRNVGTDRRLFALSWGSTDADEDPLLVANPYAKKVHVLLEHVKDKEFVIGQGIHDPCDKLHFVQLGKFMTYHGGPARLARNVRSATDDVSLLV